MVGVIVFLQMFSGTFKAGSRNILGGKSKFSKTVRSHLDPSLKNRPNANNTQSHAQSPHICLSNETQDHQHFGQSHWGEVIHLSSNICAPVWGTQFFPLFRSIKQPGLEILRKFPHATGRRSWSQRHVQVEILHIFRRPRNSRIVWRTMTVSK